MKILVSKFHKTKGELREFLKENDIKLLELLKYLRKRTYKRNYYREHYGKRK